MDFKSILRWVALLPAAVAGALLAYNLSKWGQQALQNYYAGVTFKPISKLKFDATYHYFAIATNTNNLKKELGHEVEFTAAYTPIKEVTVSLGYSYMRGSKTMEALKRVDSERQLHWAWLSLNVKPRFLQIKW